MNGVGERPLYELVKSEGDEVVLKRERYVRINWREMLSGGSLEECVKECDGSWCSLNLIRL